MPHILCAGLITVDFTFHISAFPVEGEKHRADACAMVPGGGAFTAASAIRALGGRASLLGMVGDDALGAFVRAELGARGIDTEYLRMAPGLPTSRSAVIVSGQGERTVINHRDAALFTDSIDLAFAHDGALADTRWPGGALALMRAARAAGKPGVIDAESPVRLCQDALQAASHVVFSQQGLHDYAGASDAAALADVARGLGAWVALTRGEQSVLCHDGQRASAVETFSVRPVDTLGAGDVWHGAFTLALAQGRAPHQAVRFANGAAAVKVTLGAGRMPSLAQVSAL